VTLRPGRALRVVLAALLAGLLGACQAREECTSGESHCEGDVARHCSNRVENGNSSYWSWNDTPCGAGKCKSDTSGAFCALAAEPDSRCDDPSSTFCDGTAVNQCQSGYVVSSNDCASKGNTCVTPATARQPWLKAMCATEPDPSPLCDRGNDGCDGNDSYLCASGYVTERHSCADLVCASGGYCVASADPDPGCPDRADQGSYCEGNSIVQCSGPYRANVLPCGDGKTCHVAAVACQDTFYGNGCQQASCSAQPN